MTPHLGMIGGVVLRCFVRVLFRLHVMAVSQMSVVPGLFVVARVVMLGGSDMVLRSLFIALLPGDDGQRLLSTWIVLAFESSS